MSDFIKQIKASDGKTYELDAKKWDGHSFDEITNLVHGVVDTYVIPAQSSSNKTADYKNIVESSLAQVSTTVSQLGALTGTPAADWDKFGVGDIILMGATSDGTNNFDRWISNVSGDNITLDVLETQVATHHHSVDLPVVTVSRTLTSAKALTSANPTYTTENVAKVGDSVSNILTGESGKVLTNVEYSNDGSYDLKIETGESSDYGHKHTVVSHSHTATFKPSTYVSRTLSVYYSLDSTSHTPHTHSNVTVAGTPTNSSEKTYVTGVSTSAKFIKTLKDSTQTTGANTAALATDDIADGVVTASAGDHTHSVSATTTEDAVKTVSLQANVVTSVKHSYTPPTVAETVVTSVTSESKTALATATVITSVIDTVTVSNGILSFGMVIPSVSTTNVTISGVKSVSTSTQDAGSASFSFTSGTQSYTSGKLTATCNTGSAGDHTHRFKHTHAISSHTHSYNKSVVSTSDNAITSLATSTLTTHTHNTNVSAAGAHEDGTEINIVTGGTAATVVRDLINEDQTITSATASPDTTTVYGKITGTITHPGLSLSKKEFGNTSITPAVDSGEKAIKSISFGSSSSFVTDVTITTTSGSVETSSNKGGEK